MTSSKLQTNNEVEIALPHTLRLISTKQFEKSLFVIYTSNYGLLLDIFSLWKPFQFHFMVKQVFQPLSVSNNETVAQVKYVVVLYLFEARFFYLIMGVVDIEFQTLHLFEDDLERSH